MKTTLQLTLAAWLLSGISLQARIINITYGAYHNPDGSKWAFLVPAKALHDTPELTPEQIKKGEHEGPLKPDGANAIARDHFRGVFKGREFEIKYTQVPYVYLTGDPFRHSPDGSPKRESRDFYVFTAVPKHPGKGYGLDHSRQTVVVLMDGTLLKPSRVP